MIKKTFAFILFILALSTHAQEVNLSNYKYIIVQEKFDFLKESDQYQTSSLTKFLLKKKGFEVYLSNEELPKELANDRCLALVARVTDKSTMFKIKTAIEFLDCFGKVIYTSQEGQSINKEYKRGFQDAIRNTYETMTDFEYSYNIKEKVTEKPIVEEKIVKKDAVNVDEKPKIPIKPKVETKTTEKPNTIPVLYAQPKGLGFQLVNTDPKVVFIILKTSEKDSYIIKDKNGRLYKSGEYWVAEYYANGQIVKEKYTIKF